MAITDHHHLVMMMYLRLPLSLRTVGNLPSERGIDIYHETIRLWWNRFGPMFVAKEWEQCAGFDTGAGTSTRCM